MRTLLRTLLSILALVGIAQAAAIVWNAADSANDTKWSNDANWTGGTKPGTTDTAVFTSSGGSKTPTIDVSPSIAGLRIASDFGRTLTLASGTITLTSTSATISPLTIAAGGVVINNGTVTIYQKTTSGTYWSISPTASVSGTGSWNLGANSNSVTCIITPMHSTGTGTLSIQDGGNAPFTNRITGNIIHAGPIRLRSTSFGGKRNKTLITADSLSATVLSTGPANATDTMDVSYGAGKYTVSSLDWATLNTGKCYDSLLTASFSVAGNITVGSSRTLIPGTSTITVTGASTILTLQQPLYDLTFAAPANSKDSLADSLICHNFTVTTGKIKGLSQGGYCSGNFTLGGADTVFGRMASSKWWTFPNVSTWQQTNTNRFRLIDSTKWDFTSGGSWLQDSNNTVQRIRLSSGAGGKKLVFQAGKTLTIVRPSNGDFSGTSAASIDSLVSSSAGNAAYLSYSATHIDSFTYLKDIKVIGPTFICTTGCVNGGNDSNITFPTTSTTTSTEQKSSFYTKPVYRKSYKKEPFKNESYYR